jgi:hypothetical protein
MKYTFMELSLFEQHREAYFDDEQFRAFQSFLAANPYAGNSIAGTGGLRKIRWADPGRGKGKRGGTRTIYFVHDTIAQIWLFAVYDKDMAEDLTADQKRRLKRRLDYEKAQFVR